MELTKNEEIYTLNNKLESVDASSFTTLGNNNRDCLEVLSSRIGGVLDSSSDDTWCDEVKNAVSSAISIIRGYIGRGQVASDFISGATEPVTNLKAACDQYCTAFDEYESFLAKPIPSYYEQDEYGNDKLNDYGAKIVSRDYIDWEIRKSAYFQSLLELEAQALEIKQAVTNYFDAIDLTTNTIDSNIFKAGSADLTFNFSDYFNGVLTTSYADWVSDPDRSYEFDDDGNIIEKVEGDYHREYTDGTIADTHRTEQNTYSDENSNSEVDDEDRLIDQVVHEEGTITVGDDTYDITIDEHSDEIGLVSREVEVSDQKTGDAVYTSDEEREAAYVDSFGLNVVEMTTNEETQTETRTSRVATYVAGDQVYTEGYSFSQNKEDPTCGTVIEEDGTVYTYYRDDSGVLHETETYKDKNNNEVSDDRIVDESNSQTFTMRDNSTGEIVSTYSVNPDSRLDRARMVYDTDTARTECGYGTGYETGLGVTQLESGVGSETITPVFGDDPGYTLTLE